MSSAILYLAIVAIWAVFLVPAWIKRPHTDSNTRSGEEISDPLTVETGDHDDMAGAEHYEDRQKARRQVEFIDDPYEEDCLADIAHDDVPADADLEYEYHDEYAGSSEPRQRGPEHHLPGLRTRTRSPDPPPPQNREQMLRARRSLLVILLGLTVVTAGAALAGLVHWWICVPPVTLLAFYVLLLREVAMADAELARKRADHEARMARGRRREYERAGYERAWEEQREERTAEIIDISDRIGDQFYDQYQDAEVRAVGD